MSRVTVSPLEALELRGTGVAGATLVALTVGPDWKGKPIGDVVGLFAGYDVILVNPLEHAHFLRVWREEMRKTRKWDGSTLDDVATRMYGGWSVHAFDVAAAACGGVSRRLSSRPGTVLCVNGTGGNRGTEDSCCFGHER